LSSMVITCGDCGTSFRLAVALLQGVKGGRIRCRRCDGYIVVQNPDTPRIFPAIVLEPEVPGIPVEDPKEESLPAPKEGMTAGADLSGVIQPELVEPTPDEMPFRPDPVGVEREPAPDSEPQNVDPYLVHVPALGPGGETSGGTEGPTAFDADMSGGIRFEPLPSPPDEEAVLPGSARNEMEPESGPSVKMEKATHTYIPPFEPLDGDVIRDKSAAGMAAPEPRPRASHRRRPSRSTIFLITAVCVLLLAGGALYFGTPESGQGPFGKLFPWRGKSARQNPFYDVRGVQWHTEKEIGDDNLYVIRGTVANVGRGPGNGVRIQAVAWGKDNQVLMKKTAFAGNSLDNASLRNLHPAMIEKVLNNRDGEGRVNRNIPTGKSLPFQVVFSGSSEPVESITVKATDVNEPVIFPFSGGKDTEQSSLSQRSIPFR
jgi:predicted Zn finger-like uncharacterized protein